MFEVDPNLWLQSFSAPWLLSLMVLVSKLGTETFYMVAFLLLAFGVRLWPMLGVLLAMTVAGAVTQIAKLGFALPRPSEVDSRVLDKGEAGRALVDNGAAQTFWGLPDDEAVTAVRAAGEMDYGFISGHSSAAMAFTLGLAVFFGARKRWIWGIAITWALLMGVSRMYLGRHFLADVLAGWTVGALAVWLAWRFVRAIESGGSLRHVRTWRLAVLSVAALLGISLVAPFGVPGSAGEIAGTLICLYVVSRIDVLDEGGIARRAGRIVLALPLAFGIDALLAHAWQAGGWGDQHPLAFLVACIGYSAVILGTLFVARWLHLYRPAPPLKN